MKITFRQGIISYYQISGAPQFLIASANAGYVDFNVSPDATVVTFAHGSANYIQVFDRDVNMAWGPISSSCYLYWEIDLLTADVHYKTTPLKPVYGAVAPVSPQLDQHWFDLADTTMKVWTGTKWANKIAVFAGYTPSASGSNLETYSRGSQVELLQEGDAGFIMMDAQLRPVRTSSYEFLTTTTPVHIRTTTSTSGILAIPPNAFVPIRASESIPAFSLVHFTGADTIGLATGIVTATTDSAPVGIVQTDMVANDIGMLTLSGEIQWDQWDWSADLGKALYCGPRGEITTRRPNGTLVYRVGVVKNSHTILLQIDAEVNPEIYDLLPNHMVVRGITPIQTNYQLTLAGDRTWSVGITPASITTDGYMSAAQASALNTASLRLNQLDIDVAARAMISHTQPVNTITGLQTALDNKSDLGHNHDLLYLPVGYTGFDTRYSLINHPHTIGEVAGLQTILDGLAMPLGGWPITSVNGLNLSLAGKAPLSHNQTISTIDGLQLALDTLTAAVVTLPIAVADVTNLQTSLNDLSTSIAGKALAIHTHVISDVVGLGTQLDALFNNKSNISHAHSIIDVTGLQTALDGKAPTIHTHIIADVTGLQTALNDLATLIAGKAPTVHTHVIGDVVGLDTQLDTLFSTKANTAHAHVAADITDFSEAVDDRVAALLVAGSNISLTYNDAGNTLTIASTGGSGGSVSLPATEVAVGSGTGITSSPATTVTPIDASALFGGFNIDGALNVNSPYNKVSNIIAGGHIYLGTGASGVDTFGNEIGTSAITLSNSGGGFSVEVAAAVGIFNAGSVSMNAATAEDGNAGAVVISAGNITPVSSTSNKAGKVEIHSGAYETTPGGEGFTTLAWRSGNVEFYCGSKVLMILSPTGAVTFGASSNGAGSGGAAGQLLMSYGDTAPEWMPIPSRPLTMIPFSDAEAGFGYPTIIGSADQHNSQYRCTVTTPITFTVAPDTDFPNTTTEWWDKTTTTANAPMPPGGTVLFGKHGAGDVIIAAGPGVTINTPSTLAITVMHRKARLIKVGPNEWDLEV